MRKSSSFLQVSLREKYIDLCLSMILILYKAISRNNELENPPMVYKRSCHSHGLSNLITKNYDEEKSIYLNLQFLHSKNWLGLLELMSLFGSMNVVWQVNQSVVE